MNRTRGKAVERLAYAAALLVASAGSLIVEIAAGRILAPYVGMSLYTWTSIIAVVLAGLSIGHWFGGHLAERDPRRCRQVLAAAFILAALSTLGSLVLLRLVSSMIFGLGLNPVMSIIGLTAGLFLLPSLFVGIVAPILTRLALDMAPHAHGRVLGQMFAVGAVGSVLGTLAAGLIFISWIGSQGTLVSVALAYGATGGLFAIPSVRRRPVAGLLGIGAAAALAAGGFATRAFESPCLTESDYYCIRVVDYSAETDRPSALLVLDHLGHGINDRDDPTRLVSSYMDLTDRLVQLRQGNTAFDAFFVGGGAYSLPRAWAAKYPEASLLVAEVDPAVTRTARDCLWLQPNERMRILHEDGRTALRVLPLEPLFDIVVGDAFKDISVPQHLVTQEFAREVAGRLRSGGVYAVTVVDGTRVSRFLFALVKTLRTVFPVVEVWADADQLTADQRVTYLVIAGDRATERGQIHSTNEEDRLWVRWPSNDLSARIERSGVPLLTDDFAPVDRLLWPVLQQAD
jgi:spermidine synthase